MKKTNKILMLVVLLALTLLLVSCKRPNQSPVFTITSLDTEELIVDELDIKDNLESVKFYLLAHSASTTEVSISKASEIFFIFENDERTKYVEGLSIEIQERLNQAQPETLGQASRIQGVTPAATSLILVHLRKGKLPVKNSPKD